MFVPGYQRQHGGESADDVEDGLWHLECLHPQGVGGGAAGHAEQAEEQHEAEIGHGAGHQHQHVDPGLRSNTQD